MIGTVVNNYGEKEGLVYPRKNQRWTFKEWENKATKVANAFTELGIEKGDRISAILFDSSEFVTSFYAASKIGAIFNPINFRLASGELSYILNDAESEVLLFEEATRETVEKGKSSFETVEDYIYVDDKLPDYASSFYNLMENQDSELESDVKIEEQDPYLLLYTSGTTGRPKGVLHVHRDGMEFCYILQAGLGIDHRWTLSLSGFPLYHSAGLNSVFLLSVNRGCKLVLPHHFDAEENLKLLEKESVDMTAGPPMALNWLLLADTEEYDLSSLRYIGTGGASMAPSMVKKVIEELGIERLSNLYGMTEMGPSVTIGRSDEVGKDAGVASRPLMNHEIRVVKTKGGESGLPDDTCEIDEVGEIITKGPTLMKEYWKLPEKTEEAIKDGWFYTGDAGWIDEDGFLHYKGRADDVILSGGENIYPREVESLLIEHTDVREVAAVGTPHEDFGEQVTAVIQSDREDIDNLIEELDDFCKESDELADYKRPRRYEFMDEFPKLPSGKIQRFKLKEMLKQKGE